MAEVKPLKLKDLGGGAGRLEEFASGDKIAAALLALEAWATAATPDAALTALEFGALGKALAKAANPAAGRTALGLGTAAVAALVGDVVSGGAMDYTVTATGKTWRFANGLQICTSRTVLSGVAINLPYGGSYASAALSGGSLPATFVGEYIDATTYWSSTSAGILSNIPKALEFNGAFMSCPVAIPSATVYVNGLAIGAWK